MTIARALLGVVLLCAAARLVGRRRGPVPWRVVGIGLVLQVALGALVLRTGPGRTAFEVAADLVRALIARGEPGARLVFGPLADTAALDGVFGPGAGYVFAFTANGLLTVVFFAALMGVLYHLGVMQAVVWVAARVMSWTMGVSGAESMTMAANVFAGNTEAPLVVRPYVPRMTASELNAMMTGGFATIAGSVLALYMGFVGEELAPHLLTASVMSAPAALLVAKLMVPETETSETAGAIPLTVEREAANVIEAAATGAQTGLKLALNVAAMLIAFLALVHLVDWPLEALGAWLGLERGLSLARLFGWAFAPIAWAMGVEGWHDAQVVGSLLGTKVAVNELIAYSRLHGMLAGEEGAPAFEHARSAAISAYALCGFANFGSIGVQLGGLVPLAPDRRAELARLAPRAMVGGALASWLTATIAGAFL